MPLLVPDLVLGWQGSEHPRFLSPFYLGTLLSVAYLLGTKMLSPNVSEQLRWRVITASIIFSGILSCLIISYADTWWSKGSVNPQVASVINQATNPFLIVSSDGPSLFHLLSLSNLLDPNVRIRLIDMSKMSVIPEGLTDMFLINPPEQLRQRLEGGAYRIEAAHVGKLWRLEKKP